ncbi:MAG: hypothetical protein J6A30_01945 [Ruminococcus sp.]|nr:hypothetical protein [Ruminococcus sp.]
MIKKILLIIFAVVFIVGIAGVLNREPSIEVGRLTVVYDDKEYEIEGTEIAKFTNSSLTEFKKNFDFAEIKTSAKSFDQVVVENNTNDSIKLQTDILVSYYGRVSSAYYTIYDLDGNIIEENLESLTLPTKDIAGCIIKADVKWGKESSYRQFEYFFMLNYKKS